MDSLWSNFSSMLGEDLSGANGVINSVSLKYHLPVPIGKKVFYEIQVKQISLAVKGVVLDLKAKLEDGIVCVSGTSNCSFP
jgi:hypothetical protein